MAGACLAQAPAPASAMEGGGWTQVVHGAFPCAVRGRLKVSTTGDVALRGVARDDCGFRIRQSSRGRGKPRGFTQRARAIVDTSIFTIVPADGSTDLLELELWIPRTMKEASLATKAGSVRAGDFDGSVAVNSGGGPVEVDRVGGSVAAQTVGGRIHIGRVTGGVRCFSGAGSIRVDQAGGEAWLDTAGGDIGVGLAMGPLHATTAGGNIEVERAAGAVWAKSMSGTIEIQDAGGEATAVAMGGSIQIGLARKGAVCEANSGTIRVRALEGPLRLSTAAGNVLAQLPPGRGFADLFVHSDSGDVTVLIPADFAATVRAANETPGHRGLIVSEFPQIRVVQRGGGVHPVKAEGELGGGGPALRVSTGRGRIYLLRQK